MCVVLLLSRYTIKNMNIYHYTFLLLLIKLFRFIIKQELLKILFLIIIIIKSQAGKYAIWYMTDQELANYIQGICTANASSTICCSNLDDIHNSFTIHKKLTTSNNYLYYQIGMHCVNKKRNRFVGMFFPIH